MIEGTKSIQIANRRMEREMEAEDRKCEKVE